MREQRETIGAPLDRHQGGALGAPLDRIDGRLKVTGGAKYAADFPVARIAHAVIVASTIARGRVVSMDTAAAERAPGVLKVLTPFNAPRLPGAPKPGPQEPTRAASEGGGQQQGAASGAQAQPRPMRV